MEEREPVAGCPGQGQVVQDQEGTSALARPPPEGVHQQDLVGEVERGGRLVEDQQGGFLGEGAGEKHPLPFATGELRDGPVPEIQRIDLPQRRARAIQVARPFERPEPQVRGPPHQRHLVGGEGEIVGRVLREEGDPAGALATREARERLALERNRALLGRQEAAAEPRQRALPGRVGADDADHLAAREAERDAGHRLGSAGRVAVAQLAGVEQRHCRLRIRRTKSGAPTIAVTAPTGGSAPNPRKSTRASASASTRKAAPPRAEAGRTTR